MPDSGALESYSVDSDCALDVRPLRWHYSESLGGKARAVRVSRMFSIVEDYKTRPMIEVVFMSFSSTDTVRE